MLRSVWRLQFDFVMREGNYLHWKCKAGHAGYKEGWDACFECGVSKLQGASIVLPSDLYDIRLKVIGLEETAYLASRIAYCAIMLTDGLNVVSENMRGPCWKLMTCNWK